MKRLPIFFLIVTCGCVPSAEAAPAGAGGVRTDPSPAARGEPFMSSDGWLVTIDKLIVCVQTHVKTDESGLRTSALDETLFDATKAGAVLYSPEIRPGPAMLQASLEQRTTNLRRSNPPAVFGNIDAVDHARFSQPADTSPAQLPTVLLSLHAVKDSRTLRLSLTVAAEWDPHPVAVEVRANEVALKRLAITPELAFTAPLDLEDEFMWPRQVLDLDMLADADANANNDGVVTENELWHRSSEREPVLAVRIERKLSRFLLRLDP